MRKGLFASLIVCVALLAQIGASLWGASAGRDGFAPCHRQAAALSDALASDLAARLDGGKTLPTGAPAPHDHASCSLCQLGLTAIGSAAPVLPARSVALEWRVSLNWIEVRPSGSAFNKSAPPRAPPFPV